MNQRTTASPYQQIARVCAIALPLLYTFCVIMATAAIAVLFVIMTSSGDIQFDDTTVNLATLSSLSKFGLVLTLLACLGFAIKLMWNLIKLVKCFKRGEIFSDCTASLAKSIALFLLAAFLCGWATEFFVGVISGNLNFGLSTDVVTIIFAYLFAWIIRIGSQLKAENDMTI